jgi:putative Mn2+ efflux pump MntP
LYIDKVKNFKERIFMGVLEIIAIGVALSMDACAITVANCTAYQKDLTLKKQWSMPIAFAIFQGIMPLIGFYLGTFFAEYLSSIGGFITAGIFYVLAGKIIFDIIKDSKEKDTDNQPKKNQLTYSMIIIQAVATSIDALIIGVTLSLSLTTPFLAVGLIAVTTFALVTVAMLLGKSLGKFLGKYAEWAGAIILFIIATKELITALI